MHKALLPSLLLASAALHMGDELRYAPEEDLTITHTFLAITETSLVSATLEVDGEIVREVEEEELEGALDRVSTERIELSDSISSVEDGRAIEFTRTFVELLQESEQTSGDQEHNTSSKSDLEGISIDFSWDEGAEEFDASFSDEDCEVDEALLEELSDDVDLRRLLPEDEVQVGDEWEFDDPAAYLPLMWPGGLLGFYEEDLEGFSEKSRADNIEIIENLEVSCVVTYEGEEERDGVRVALLSVSMEIEGGTENEIEPDEGPAYILAIEIERSIEGEVYWDLEHDHLFEASFEGDIKTSISQSADVTNPETDEELAVVDTKVIEGTITYSISVERE